MSVLGLHFLSVWADLLSTPEKAQLQTFLTHPFA